MSIRFVFASNDSMIDDLLGFLNDCEAHRPGSVFPSQRKSGSEGGPPSCASGKVKLAPSHMDDEVDLGALDEGLRQAASALSSVAEAISKKLDRKGRGISIGRAASPSQTTRASSLLALAERLLAHRLEREQHFPEDLFGEPAWEMLLDLFCQYERQTWISCKSLAVASRAPETTALRYIDKLEAAGLISRKKDLKDKRVTLVGLSEEGAARVTQFLENLAEKQDEHHAS